MLRKEGYSSIKRDKHASALDDFFFRAVDTKHSFEKRSILIEMVFAKNLHYF